MIVYKTNEEIELIRESCLLVCKTLTHVASLLHPGISGRELDDAAETFIKDHKAVPGFKGYRGFPGTLCISKNEVVVHGIPSEEPFVSGDIVSIDCGVLMNGYFGDAAYTFSIGEVDAETMKLLRITKESLYRGIEQAKVGNRIGDISSAIQKFTENENGYGVVRELVGHGLGENLHESPEVPNYGKRGKGPLLKRGLVIAIEPMITLGKRDIRQGKDGWTIFTKDRKPSAHYEHTIAVKNGVADILSDHSEIENTIKKNADLNEI
jgi:methionyl aminopeptidase